MVVNEHMTLILAAVVPQQTLLHGSAPVYVYVVLISAGGELDAGIIRQSSDRKPFFSVKTIAYHS